jgi:hypothetical protein
LDSAKGRIEEFRWDLGGKEPPIQFRLSSQSGHHKLRRIAPDWVAQTGHQGLQHAIQTHA